ncbi:MAG: hypothetical protein MUO26_09900 [Methanotrichaceae archaeon]|nr:hypothetical protein [Methanotrichaceae archaeon]
MKPVTLLIRIQISDISVTVYASVYPYYLEIRPCFGQDKAGEVRAVFVTLNPAHFQAASPLANRAAGSL